nr:S8 family serine peptidase [uncultured Desulfobacter sp.]
MTQLPEIFTRTCLLIIAVLFILPFSGRGYAKSNVQNHSTDQSDLVETDTIETVDWNKVFGKNKAQKAKALFSDPKITSSKSILKDFIDQKTTSKVIVNFKIPDEKTHKNRMKTRSGRKEARQSVNQLQQEVLSRMDLNEVQTTSRFKFNYGITAEVTLEGLSQLTDDPDVVSIEEIMTIYPHGAQAIPLINATQARQTYGGAGVGIAICDTGIDYTHPMLGGSQDFPNEKVIDGYDIGNDDDDPMDYTGHGTCCAGIAAGDIGATGDYIGGVAPDAKLYAVKMTTDSSDSCGTDDMIAAWEWCIEHQADNEDYPIMIISTSFGGGSYSSACDSVSTSMTRAAETANDAGITIFASSGNDGYCSAIAWPACISSVVSVGAVYDADLDELAFCVDEYSCVTADTSYSCSWGYKAVSDDTDADMVTSYSNSASILDLLAPSNDSYTTDITGSSGYSSDNYYSSFGGTSAACPYAAGAAAVLISAANTSLGGFSDPDKLRTLMTGTGVEITDEKSNITKPRIDLQAAIDSLGPNFSAASTTLCFYEDNSTTFTDDSDGEPLSREWAFIPDTVTYLDGTSSSQSPVVQFDVPGTYSVSLTVIYDNGTSGTTITKNDYINVHEQCQDLALDLTMSSRGAQITWTLENDEQETLYSGGPYSLGHRPGDPQVLEASESFSLPSGEYTLTISNGGTSLFYSSYGSVAYSLTNEDREETIVSESDADDEEITTFTLISLTDIDADSDVDGEDLVSFCQSYAEGLLPNADVNSDETVDEKDLALFVLNFGG